MSILDRIKSLFTGDKNEEKEVRKVEVKTTDKPNTSSKDQNIVSNKTSETISKKEHVDKTNSFDEKDIPSKEKAPIDDAKSSENIKIEETQEEPIVKEAPVEDVKSSEPESAEVLEGEEPPLEPEVEETSIEIESTEKNISEDKNEDENSNKKNKKRDNMTLLTDSELIKDESLDKDFTAAFIDAGLETVKHCFQCGTCGGSCPSGRRTPYKVRQIVRKCLLGLKEEVISDDALWMCTTCYTCQERCPRSVIIVGIIKKARNIAAHAGYMALPHKKTGLFVIKTGHGVPINDKTKALRKAIGLEEVPPTTHAYPEALEEVQTICKLCKFDDLIGYDEATGDLKE